MRAISVLVLGVVVIALWAEIESAPLALVSARQFLPPIPGYIPVFIRQGDEPLENINADLAAAFRSYAAKHQINTGRAINEITPALPVHGKTGPKEETDRPSQFIQKISPNKRVQA